MRLPRAIRAFDDWRLRDAALPASLLEQWRLFLAAPSVAVRVRRHPRLLQALAERAGTPLSAAELRAARRLRLRLTPAPAFFFAAAERRRSAVAKRPLVSCCRAAGLQYAPTGAVVEQHPALRPLLALCTGRTSWNPYTVAALCQMAVGVQDLATWDGPRLRAEIAAAAERLDWNTTMVHGVRAALWSARIHPSLDPDHAFQTHLHAVPRAFLERHPLLWQYPWNLAHHLRTQVACPVEVDHLLGLLDDLARHRLVRLPPQRDAQRSRGSLARRFLWILLLMRNCHPRPLTWHADILPRSLDLRGLTTLLAKAVAHYHASPRPRWHGRLSPVFVDVRHSLLAFFQTAINDGVFEPTIAAGTVLDVADVASAMHRLEGLDGTAYSASPAAVTERDRTRVTDAIIGRLAEACATAMERSLLLLLSTTGVRSCAIGMARVTDVWDGHSVRSRCYLVEKNSDVRVIVPSRELAAALAAYVTREHDGQSTLLFPSRRRPLVPSSSVARTILGRLCRRAQVRPAVSPHQFRHYLVNRLMQEGHRLESVARWLGHRNVNVTFKFYWTDHGPDALLPPPSRRDDELLKALQQQANEYERLQQLLIG